MLAALGFATLDELSKAAVPTAIADRRPLALPSPKTEAETLAALAPWPIGTVWSRR